MLLDIARETTKKDTAQHLDLAHSVRYVHIYSLHLCRAPTYTVWARCVWAEKKTYVTLDIGCQRQYRSCQWISIMVFGYCFRKVCIYSTHTHIICLMCPHVDIGGKYKKKTVWERRNIYRKLWKFVYCWATDIMRIYTPTKTEAAHVYDQWSVTDINGGYWKIL